MTAHHREIQATAEHNYASWTHCFLAAFLVATLGVTADAQSLTFNDPNATTEDNFGRSVALDGNKVLIGAYRDDTNGFDVGQAHLFDAFTGSLLRTFNDPNATVSDNFGRSVAIDGNSVLIGAPGDNEAHLFDAMTGNLLQSFNDPTVTTSDNFGFSVALDGNNVLIGDRLDDTNGNNAGQAYLFDLAGNLLQTFNDPTAAPSDSFGFSVALEGNNVLIGLPFANIGQAHLFDAVTGRLLRTFNDPTPTVRDSFGFTVTLDGNNVLIGAPSDDTNGTDVGQAHLFDALTTDLLQTFDDPNATGGGSFGTSVALVGNNVLIGDTRNQVPAAVGQAHLFDLSGNLLQTFDDPNPTGGDSFGVSVALDGNNVLIGAHLDNTNGTDVGQAHLFTILPGDFDGTGKVDGNDFLLWQRNPSVGSLADWEANYGTVAPLSASSAGIPEPTTCTLSPSRTLLGNEQTALFLSWQVGVEHWPRILDIGACLLGRESTAGVRR